MSALELDNSSAGLQIKAYQAGMIKINEQIFHNNLILSNNELHENWIDGGALQITANDLAIIMKLKPDVVLIGTGANTEFLTPDIYAALINAGIGVEIMTTSAACRTFNALTAENRQVVAALIV